MVIFLWMALGWALVACIVHERERVAARRRVGRVLSVERSSSRARVLYMGVGCVVLFLVLLSCLGVLVTGAWAIPGYAATYLIAGALIILSLAAVALAQPQGGEVFGTEGVRCGSWAYAYRDLDEWRLTGDHLRFRSGAVWRAVTVPPQVQGELRRRLETASSDRESRFSR